jgi:L-threonylcarbamoyladenylate synthase
VSHEVEAAVATLQEGGLAIVPTDTVYGLACAPEQAEAVARLSALKGRTPEQPIALVAASFDALFERIPELRGEDEDIARLLLPGPYTLVLRNPARRYPWLAGAPSETIGVRVPNLSGVARDLFERVGALAATSANVHGGPDPARVEEVPDELRRAAVLVDGGKLPGLPSTVLDLTGREPRVIREGAVPASEALARVSAE